MSNGGQYFNPDYGGEVYYNAPSTIGAVRFVDDLVHKHKVHARGRHRRQRRHDRLLRRPRPR